jgi:hypothetical protein
MGLKSKLLQILAMPFGSYGTYIRFAVWFMVGGWAAVQTLLAASHRREVDNIDRATLLRCALALEAKLQNPVIWVVLSLVFLPLFGYLSFVMCYRTATLSISMKWAFYFVYFTYLMAVYFADVLVRDFLLGIFSCIRRRQRFGQCAAGLCTESRPINGIPLILYTLFLLVLFFVGAFMGAAH